MDRFPVRVHKPPKRVLGERGHVLIRFGGNLTQLAGQGRSEAYSGIHGRDSIIGRKLPGASRHPITGGRFTPFTGACSETWSAIRLEIVNGDSPVTDVLWTHYYQPNKIGQDTTHHSARYPSQLFLPVME